MTSNSRKARATHWSQIEERGIYYGLHTMLLTYKVFGRKTFLALLCPVIAYFFVFGGDARRASLQFLTRVYKSERGAVVFKHPPGWRESYAHMWSFGEAILDKLAAWVGEIDPSSVDFENVDIIEKLADSNRGGLLLVSHLGNSEVSRALGRLSLGRKMNVLVHTKHSANFNRVMQQVNPESTMSLIQVTDVNPAIAMMLSEKIAGGEFVVIVGDRTPVVRGSNGGPQRVSWVPFLGHIAPFPQGPFILASLLKCPVQTMFCLKKNGRYRVVFEEFADVIEIPRKCREEILQKCVEKYAKRLENHCITNPYQWFNFFDFWLQAGTMPRP